MHIWLLLHSYVYVLETGPCHPFIDLSFRPFCQALGVYPVWLFYARIPVFPTWPWEIQHDHPSESKKVFCF